MMRVYLCGPVSGVPRIEAEQRFRDGERMARAKFGPDCEIFSPVKEVPRDAWHVAAMTFCIGELSGFVDIESGKIAKSAYDALLVLDRNLSPGMIVEISAAYAMGVAVYVADMESVGDYTMAKVVKAETVISGVMMILED